MAAPVSLAQVGDMAAQLPPDEQRQLAVDILRGLTIARPKRHWREIRGIVAYPMFGDDAQAWVSRTRRESDEVRERFHGAGE